MTATLIEQTTSYCPSSQPGRAIQKLWRESNSLAEERHELEMRMADLVRREQAHLKKVSSAVTQKLIPPTSSYVVEGQSHGKSTIAWIAIGDKPGCNHYVVHSQVIYA